jgi:hypothetical protein
LSYASRWVRASGGSLKPRQDPVGAFGNLGEAGPISGLMQRSRTLLLIATRTRIGNEKAALLAVFVDFVDGG